MPYSIGARHDVQCHMKVAALIGRHGDAGQIAFCRSLGHMTVPVEFGLVAFAEERQVIGDADFAALGGADRRECKECVRRTIKPTIYNENAAHRNPSDSARATSRRVCLSSS